MKPAGISSTRPIISKCLWDCIALSRLTCHLSQDQRSEEFIGDWVEQRGIRDQLVIATKVSANVPLDNVLLIYGYGQVFVKLYARGGCRAAKGAVRGKQREIDARECRSELEETEDVVRRHPLCPLVGLGD